ncbi:MAG: hypothetical protein HY259_11535 [Chloroflexi bacterium]|nr:hypothetical protein [Chloroflexota bacterium]MBI3734069.1 hypothetical protein [Chloroflexota bacterium]
MTLEEELALQQCAREQAALNYDFDAIVNGLHAFIQEWQIRCTEVELIEVAHAAIAESETAIAPVGPTGSPQSAATRRRNSNRRRTERRRSDRRQSSRRKRDRALLAPGAGDRRARERRKGRRRQGERRLRVRRIEER